MIVVLRIYIVSKVCSLLFLSLASTSNLVLVIAVSNLRNDRKKHFKLGFYFIICLIATHDGSSLFYEQ